MGNSLPEWYGGGTVPPITAFSGNEGNCRRYSALAVPSKGSLFLWFPQIFDDGFHLPWREALAARLVSCFAEEVPQRLAESNPCPEVIYGCAWQALGKVQEGEFLLGVLSDFEIFFHLIHFFMF